MDRLIAAWRLRNACAMALEQAIDAVESAVCEASDQELVALIESFAPARSSSPEYAATLDRLVELLWDTVPGRMPSLHAVFAERNPRQWGAIANMLAPAAGTRREQQRFQPPGARRPAVVLR
ncbi:MAG: hypothetical protein KC482_08770 [Dehalococcoidia bacterium]|nr:hypothetical protein [Dehalococcoidia bacterium]MCA9853677.1 hypothetical protein [Dehalococcoidia bacterium]